jgi:hypothetical protein
VRRGIVIAGIVVAALLALSLRIVLEGRSALADGDDAMMRGQTRDAIAAWQSAARWYLPLAPHVGDAYERLTTLATSARDKGDRTTALLAYRAIRSAALATKSLWTPHAGDLDAANEQIAQLSADDPDAAPAGGDTRDARMAFHRAQLAGSRPGGWAAGLAILGIVAWLTGFGYLGARGIDSAGRPNRRRITVGTVIVVAGFGAWALGLYNA